MVVYVKLVEHECFTNKEHLDRLEYDRAEFAPLRWDRLLQKGTTNFNHRSQEWCNEVARILGDRRSESAETSIEKQAIDAPFKIRLNSPRIVQRRRERSDNRLRNSQVLNKKIENINKKRPYDVKKQVLNTLSLSNELSHTNLPILCSKILLVYKNRIDTINTHDINSSIYMMTDDQYKNFERMVKEEKQKDALEVEKRRKAVLEEGNREEQEIKGKNGFI